MDIESIVQIIVAILAGLSTAIPLVVKLVSVVTSATREKNWNQLIKMTMDYMVQAEQNLTVGADRKEWVLSMIKTSADTINYTLTTEDISKLSDLIDAICNASNTINTPKEKERVVKSTKKVTKRA